MDIASILCRRVGSISHQPKAKYLMSQVERGLEASKVVYLLIFLLSAQQYAMDAKLPFSKKTLVESGYLFDFFDFLIN